MPRVVKDVRQFTAERAWGARDLAEVEGASVRLHWTDQPYVWHVNDGSEVFVVLDGTVEMRWREAGVERSTRLASSSPARATSMSPTRRARPASWSSSARARSDGRYRSPRQGAGAATLARFDRLTMKRRTG